MIQNLDRGCLKLKINIAKIKSLYYLCIVKMVDVAQLVRVADCGSVGRGFESHLPPKKAHRMRCAFCFCVHDDLF